MLLPELFPLVPERQSTLRRAVEARCRFTDPGFWQLSLPLVPAPRQRAGSWPGAWGLQTPPGPPTRSSRPGVPVSAPTSSSALRLKVCPPHSPWGVCWSPRGVCAPSVSCGLRAVCCRHVLEAASLPSHVCESRAVVALPFCCPSESRGLASSIPILHPRAPASHFQVQPTGGGPAARGSCGPWEPASCPSQHPRARGRMRFGRGPHCQLLRGSLSSPLPHGARITTDLNLVSHPSGLLKLRVWGAPNTRHKSSSTIPGRPSTKQRFHVGPPRDPISQMRTFPKGTA